MRERGQDLLALNDVSDFTVVIPRTCNPDACEYLCRGGYLLNNGQLQKAHTLQALVHLSLIVTPTPDISGPFYNMVVWLKEIAQLMLTQPVFFLFLLLFLTIPSKGHSGVYYRPC